MKKYVYGLICILAVLWTTVSHAEDIIPMTWPGGSSLCLGVTDDVNKLPMMFRTTTEGYPKVSLATAISSGTDSIQGMQYQYDGTTWWPILAYKSYSVSGITGNNVAGPIQNVSVSPMTNYTMVVLRTAGTTNVVDVDLQCSLDNSNFVQIATITDLTNSSAITSVSGVPCLYFRGYATTGGSGNTLTIQIVGTK